jgi:hypothetical protein
MDFQHAGALIESGLLLGICLRLGRRKAKVAERRRLSVTGPQCHVQCLIGSGDKSGSRRLGREPLCGNGNLVVSWSQTLYRISSGGIALSLARLTAGDVLD